MDNLIDLLTAKFQQAYRQAFPDAAPDTVMEVTPSTQPQFGDYQCNSAMKLAKELKSSPRAIAERLVAQLDRSSAEGMPLIAKTEVAGPGFINVFLTPSWASVQLDRIVRDERLGIPRPKKRQRIIVEFSSPNVAKELHVGHLRSTIIGDCLARLFEFLDHEVLRLNHIGDWGTQFGMLIVYLKEEHPLVLSGQIRPQLIDLMGWYRAAKKRFDELPAFKARAQAEVVRLQSGDPTALKAWGLICDISRQSYQEIYDLLDVHLQERGESYYNPRLPEVIADLEKKHLLTVSDGAKCFYIEGYVNREGDPLPIILQKSDGGYNYDTTDMAALRHRIEDEKADRIIIVTDAGQSLHFEMLFKAAQIAGYLDPQRVRVDHVAFGVVLGPDGKKFKTRSGETERLLDLLTKAIDHAHRILVERQVELSPAELEGVAKTLGIGAVKYADLSCMRTGDYTFSYERMLRFEGNTAAFLLYSYVRVLGIKRKVGKEWTAFSQSTIQLHHPSEIALGLHLLRFREILDNLARDLLPHRLAEYLYQTAEKFNAFFRDCRVEGTPEEDARLLLCEATARTLERGLQILGIHTVERM